MARLLKLVKDEHQRNYQRGLEWKKSHDTPAFKLASERNFCRYILAGMDGLCIVFKRFGVAQFHIDALQRQIGSMRYAVDAKYYDKLDRMNKRR